MVKEFRLLYISYWGIEEGLTQSTVLPHLKLLSQFKKIEKITFVTIERNSTFEPKHINVDKVQHMPLYSKFPIPFLNKILDFIIFPRTLQRIIKENNINYILCRSSLAGALGYLLWRKERIPFSVESFEPHADYMLELNVWSRFGLKYIMQKHWEEKQKKFAHYLITVSHQFKEKLFKEGVDNSKIQVAPCSVDYQTFSFNSKDRMVVRNRLGVTENQVVGIYVGKFGDIYFDEEAFELFKKAFDYFKENFFLILLSPHSQKELVNKLINAGFPLHATFTDTVPLKQVPHYLSAADFAFSTIRPTPYRRYCSPIKNGEYWANGLPILTPDGIGDDSFIIKNNGGGVLLSNIEKPIDALSQIAQQVGTRIQNHSKIAELAKVYRNLDLVRNTYKKLFL